MDTPRISSITPCFRMKPYLKLFLEELPKQTIFNEIEIVLDHNEPDQEELAWIKEFQEKYPGRLTHIITNPVVPIGTSMNTCIRAAKAPYLTIWNVDDLRTPNSMELTVKAFDGGADIVYGNFEVVRKFGAKSGSLTDFSKYQNQPEEFTRSMLLGPFMAFRKSLVEKAGLFDEQLKSGADFDLAIRLAFHGKPVMAEGLLGYYLNEGKGASTRPDSKQALDRTVIELRYGIYDKLDYDLVAQATQFDLVSIHVEGASVPVDNLVPSYHDLLEERRLLWHKQGLRRHFVNTLLWHKEIRRLLSFYYKNTSLKMNKHLKYKLLKPFYFIRKKAYNLLKKFGYRYNLDIYTDDFFRENAENGIKTARWFLPLLKSHIGFSSFIDIGCGRGHYLLAADEIGINRSLGIEGSDNAFLNLFVDKSRILQRDLRDPVRLDETWDMAISIEVAEHIDREYSDVYLDTLTKYVNWVVMTAARPGQGGTAHVNEQNPEWWIERMKKRNFVLNEELLSKIKQDIDVAEQSGEFTEPWLKDNLMIFRKSE